MAQRRAARGSKAQSHGDRTRARLIEVAGQVFAERGVHAATGQQICRRAGANAAAIVYHFGGMAGLYRAVLAQAQQRLVSTAALAAAVAAQRNPALKLLASPASRSWAGKLFGRELVSPSAMFGRSHDRLLRPRAAILRSIAAELCGRAPQDPAVARACLSIMAPCVVLLLVDHGKMRRVFPQLRLRPADAPRLTQHLTVFALAGLRALRLSHTPAVRAARG
jgi:AcrR family transcriptional regulator